jgi:hypothetical protein
MVRMLRLFIGLLTCSLYSRRDLLLEFWLCDNSSMSSRQDTRGQGSLLGTESFGWCCAVLAGEEARACHCPTADSRRLASGWLRTVLDMALIRLAQAGSELAKKRARTDLPHVAENPSWGAPRIHGELEMLGFVVLNH